MAAVGEAGPSGLSKPAMTLEAMPPEILGLILENLVPQPPEIGETRPVAYDSMVAEEPWFEFTRRRRGLHSACLASRHLCELARPLLYRNMAVWNEMSLVLLFRTLSSKPEYGLWTRYMSCHMTLSHVAVIRDVRRALTTLLPTFNPGPETNILSTALSQFAMLLRFSLPHMSTNQGDIDHMPQALLCLILMCLLKLETLLMQIPICEDDGEYGLFCQQIGTIKNLFASEPESMPFQNIHTLHLQGDPELIAQFEDGDCECEYYEVWGCQAANYASLFTNFPKLTTLEVSGDDSVWSNIANDALTTTFLSGGAPPPPFLERIRHIYLHDSAATPRDLHHLLLNAPNLETLYMALRPGALDREIDLDPTIQETDNNNDPESLDNALSSGLAPRLRNLDVSWDNLTDLESLVGPDGRLTALPSMTSLQTLCIQMATLYGSPAAVASSAPLIDLLPPNLVELALEDYWWANAEQLETLPEWDTRQKVTHYQSQAGYRASAVRMLGEFAAAVGTEGRLEKLKKVVLLCRIPWTWVLEGAVASEFHFEEVKAILGGKGVEFEVRCDEVMEGGVGAYVRAWE